MFQRISPRGMAALAGVGVLLSLLFGATAAGAATHPVPADDSARGLVYAGLERVSSGPCKNGYRIKGTDKCTHGPDAPPAGFDVKQSVAPRTTATLAAGTCIGDGSSGLRVQMMYVHPPTVNRYSQYKASFEQWAVDMDTIYNASAAETGGTRHVRFVHDANCTPTILNVQVSASALSNFSATISALRSLGYTRTDRKYSIFGESNVYCGIGEFEDDDRKISGNRSNTGPHFARSDSGCWNGHTIAHELGHNLGAVSNSAPNSSGGAHCTDEYDVMCYSDSPNYPPMRYICANQSHENRLDCGHNDYYHTNPSASSYLGTHYNMADNPFLSGSTTPPPGGCQGYANRFTGSLSSGQSAYHPNGSYFYTGNSGQHSACLDGPTGTDFDLELQRWNGSSWVVVASGTSANPDESFTYNGTAAYYRYRVLAYSGSGSYTIGYTAP